MADTTTCARHPSTETGLRCVSCETPICPKCAVEAPIGMRCPSCAKPDRRGGLRRRPDQIRNAAFVAVAGAVVGGAILVLLAIVLRGWFTLIAAYFVGQQVAVRVRRAAGGNTVDVVTGLAIGGAVGAALVVDLYPLLFGRGVGVGVYSLLRAGIAGYAAYTAMR